MTTYGDGAANTMTTANANAKAKASAKVRKASRPVTHRSQVWQQSRAEGRASRAKGLDTGWTIFSYLIGGMIAYGAIGWGIGKAVHIGWLFPVGMLVGLAISLGFVIHRYGRQAAADQDAAASTAGKSSTPVKSSTPGMSKSKSNATGKKQDDGLGAVGRNDR